MANWIRSKDPVAFRDIETHPQPDVVTASKALRIIPCLDVKDGMVVKGIQFQNIKEVGNPAELSKLYEAQGADEIVVLDISATTGTKMLILLKLEESRQTKLETIRQVREVLSIPLTVGGGVKTLQDVQSILEAGADKVAVNTAAVRNPGSNSPVHSNTQDILSQMSERFGRQCTVLSLDAKSGDNKWEVVVSAGTEKTGIDAIEWAKVL